MTLLSAGCRRSLHRAGRSASGRGSVPAGPISVSCLCPAGMGDSAPPSESRAEREARLEAERTERRAQMSRVAASVPEDRQAMAHAHSTGHSVRPSLPFFACPSTRFFVQARRTAVPRALNRHCPPSLRLLQLRESHAMLAACKAAYTAPPPMPGGAPGGPPGHQQVQPVVVEAAPAARDEAWAEALPFDELCSFARDDSLPGRALACSLFILG